MRPTMSWLYVVAGSALTLVAVSAVAQSVRQGSWSPLISVSWLPGVAAAVWARTARRCLPRRHQAR